MLLIIRVQKLQACNAIYVAHFCVCTQNDDDDSIISLE